MTQEKESELEHLRQSVSNLSVQKLIEIEEELYCGVHFHNPVGNLQNLILTELRERNRLLDKDNGIEVAARITKELREKYPDYKYNVFITRKSGAQFGNIFYFLNVEIDVPIALIEKDGHAGCKYGFASLARDRATYWGMKDIEIILKSTERDNQQLHQAMVKTRAQEEMDGHIWSATSFERGFWAGKESKS